MAFTQKTLKFRFSGAKSGDLIVEGLRAAVTMQAFPGQSGNLCQAKIWGLTMGQMTAYSSPYASMPNPSGITPYVCVIEAGDLGSNLVKLLGGQIFSSFIDIDAPESSFNISIVGTILQAVSMISSQSVPPQTPGTPSTQPAETLIQNICAAAGLTLNNNGAHSMLRNQVTSGSPISQIAKIADAARINWYFDGTVVWLWPRGGQRDATIIPVGPNAGMVGYPKFQPSGLSVTCEFNPQIQIGRQMQLTSSIPNAQGLWDIIQVQHDLTTMIEGGPWFTTALLVWPGTTTGGDSSND